MKNLPWLVVVVLGITSLVLGGQLSGEKSQLHDANSKLENVQSQLSSTQSQLDDANSKLQTTQQQLDTAQSTAASAVLPEIHCRLGWTDPDAGGDTRPSATVYNDDDADVTLTFVASRDNATPKELDDVVVPPHGSTTVVIPGWTFITGDKLTVSEAGHKSAFWTVPAP